MSQPRLSFPEGIGLSMLKKEAAAVDLALWERNPVTLGVALQPFKLNVKAVSQSKDTD